jgi:hypothetical protein
VTVVTLLVPTLAATGKVTELDPCTIVTLAGTDAAAALELESVITAPPARAGVERFTVATPDWPGAKVEGLTANPVSATGG